MEVHENLPKIVFVGLVFYEICLYWSFFNIKAVIEKAVKDKEGSLFYGQYTGYSGKIWISIYRLAIAMTFLLILYIIILSLFDYLGNFTHFNPNN